MGVGSTRPAQPTDNMDVEEIITNNNMVVFATSTCPYCRRAIDELGQAGFEPTVVFVSQTQRADLRTKTGQTSVPQVFVKGEFIGGCNDGGMGGTIPLLKSGKIYEMMQA